jgi:hypothetical protein
MRLKERADEYVEELNEDIMWAATSIIACGPSEVEELVHAAAQKEGDGGLLSRAQVKALLKTPKLGISKQQSNSAATAVEFDAGGMVAASALAPQLYDLIVRVVAQSLAMDAAGDVGKEVEQLCEHYDKEGTGFLDPRVLKEALKFGFQYLTRLQANALVSDPAAPVNEVGHIAWRVYLPKLVAVIKAMGDPAAIRERAEIAGRAEFQPVELMSGRDKEAINTMLTGLFQNADADQSGYLDHAEFKKCMAEADLGLRDADINDLLYEFDANGDGKISLEEFAALAYEFILTITRERAINQSLHGEGA